MENEKQFPKITMKDREDNRINPTSITLFIDVELG